eukprot:3385248-Alexandrium_andersonii.AAC.1
MIRPSLEQLTPGVDKLTSRVEASTSESETSTLGGRLFELPWGPCRTIYLGSMTSRQSDFQ